MERFINTYTEDEFDDICDLLDNVYKTLPSTLVVPIDEYEKHIENGDYDRAFKCAIGFFEISIQYISGLIISILNHNNSVFDDELQKTIEKIVQKPLSFGDWVNDIFITLIKKSHEIIPEHLLTQKCYNDLFGDKSGNFLLGWNRKGEQYKNIVSYRNSYVGHDSFLSNEIYKEGLVIIEPRIWKMLSMLSPLSSYQFFVLDQVLTASDEQKPYTIFVDSGMQPTCFRIKSDLQLDEYSYYFTGIEIKHRGFIKGSDIIKLSPFVIYYYDNEINLDKKFSYVFQTLADRNLNRMVFISSDENVRRKETELFKETFWDLLQRIFGRLIQKEKSKISFKKEKTFDEYRERIEAQTNKFISQQVHSDKFDPDVFLDREYLSENYLRFKKSNCAGFVILGNAGAGKTNQICYWSSKISPSFFSLAFNSKIFTQQNLEEQLRETFNEPEKKACDILESLDASLEKESASCCIFFDAINECSSYKGAEIGNGPIDLLMAIHKLFVENKFKNIKVVISCRNYTWEELLNKDGLLELATEYFTVSNRANDPIIIKGFSEKEFNLVYPKYQVKYLLKTSLEKISEDHYAFVKMRLYDPLILKTASQNFSGREFPSDLRQFNSTHLFEQRLDDLEKQPVGRLQISILRDFTTYLWNIFTDSIPIDTLQDAYENNADAAHIFACKIFTGDTFRYSEAFISLLDEGVLRIEKGFRKELRFVYERFHEFLFARHFIITESSSPVFRKSPIEAYAYENVLKVAGHSTVMIAALRNALIMDFYQKGSDPATIIQLALSHLYESRPLVEETLSVLINENYSDVLGILEYMLEYKKEESADLLKKRTDFNELLQSPKKSARLSETGRKELEEKLKQVNEEIFKILKVRQIAVSVTYKIYKSENINDLLNDKKTDPGKLLWLAMADPLPEVRDNASIYIYYIARYNPRLGKELILTLSDKVKSTPVFALFKQSSRKELQQSYIEPACRVGLFLVIDGLIERKDYAQALEIMNVWKNVVRKFTLNHTIIKIVMPFFKFLFSRQTIVQTEYVNNAIEYRYFWDHIPLDAPSPQWSRTVFRKLVPFLDPATTNFRQYEQQIINGYCTGDSFSFFLLERILIVQALVDWNNVSGLIQQLIHLPETEKYKPYIEMSLIYSLFQINHKSENAIPQAEVVFSSVVLSWCLKNKGFFYAHYNDKANGGKPYKQYVLYWYAAAYCHRHGDGMVKEGDSENVPVFRELIYTSYKQRDKVLLYNCIENMAVMVSAMGFYKTSLQLFEYLISLFSKESEIREFDNIKIDVSPVYNVGLRSFICDMLGTVKSYFPKEVDHFIVNKLKNSGFPALDAFREEIFNHSLSHEGIGDLLTHKFGNFVIWGILNDIHIRKFFIEIYSFSIVSKNYPEWFDYCIRHIFQEVFDVKNLQKASAE